MTNFEQECEWLLKEKYSGNKTEEYFVDIKRIQDGEPVAYVIGFSNFLGCKIDLSYKPLIPRVETEYWVENAIDEIKKRYNDERVKCFDIFSGSGCIGISILKRIENSFVVFSDIDENMLIQIKKNLDLNNISQDRYKIIKSDIFSDINEKFDVIFANPPYIDRARNVTDESVIQHEPHTALFAEKNGMEIIEKFLEHMRDRLLQKFIVFIEHDDDQVDRINSALVKNGYRNFSFNKDQFGLFRTVSIYENIQ